MSSPRTAKLKYHSRTDPDFLSAVIDLKSPDRATLPSDTSFYVLGNEVAYRGNLLGAGAYGKVSVFHTQLNSAYVIKQIDYSSAPNPKEFLLSIMREAELNKLVHGVGDLSIQESKRTAYLRMKKLPPTIQYIFFEEKGRYQFKSYSEFLRLFINILMAAKKLHEVYGVVHGDITCQNICMEKTGEIEFCDLGLSRKLRRSNQNPLPELTYGVRTEVSWHLPPELESEILAATSQDVYSLGQLLVNFKHSLRCLTLDERAHLGQIYADMTRVNPQERCQLAQVLTACINKYNVLNPMAQLSNDFVVPHELVRSSAQASLKPLGGFCSLDTILSRGGMVLLIIGFCLALFGFFSLVSLGVGSLSFGFGFGMLTCFASSRTTFQDWFEKQNRLMKLVTIFFVGLFVATVMGIVGGLECVAFGSVGMGSMLVALFAGDVVSANMLGGKSAGAICLSVIIKAMIDLSVGAGVIKVGNMLSTTARLHQMGLMGQAPESKMERGELVPEAVALKGIASNEVEFVPVRTAARSMLV